MDGRPEHGGRDRHVAFTISDLQPLKGRLDDAGVTYTMSKSGRAALFCRDLDGNAFEVTMRTNHFLCGHSNSAEVVRRKVAHVTRTSVRIPRCLLPPFFLWFLYIGTSVNRSLVCVSFALDLTRHVFIFAADVFRPASFSSVDHDTRRLKLNWQQAHLVSPL